MQKISETLNTILTNEPAYRRAQIEAAWFDVSLNSYDEITTLPLELREKLKDLPWLTLETHTELKSKVDNTRKYLFKLGDGNLIEMVLMGRMSLRGVRNERRGNPQVFRTDSFNALALLTWGLLRRRANSFSQ